MLLTSPGSKERYVTLTLQAGALTVGAHCLSSGFHSPIKFIIEPVCKEPRWAEMVDPLLELPFGRIDALVAVSRGGIPIAQAIARRIQLREHRKVRVVKTGKEINGSHTLSEQDAGSIAGLSVLITDDVLTTGKSLLATISQLINADTHIAGCAVLLNRAIQGVSQRLEPYTIGYSLSWLDFPDYQEPLWQIYEYSWQTPKVWFLARRCHDSRCQVIARFHDDGKDWTTISGSWDMSVIEEACRRGIDPLLVKL